MKATSDKLTWKRLPKVVIEDGEAKMYITPRRQLQLISLALRQLIKSGYKPDLVIGIATGGLYAALVARALEVPYGIWMAQGYDHRMEKSGKAGKRYRSTWFSPEIAILRKGRSTAKGKNQTGSLCHRLLLVDDLDDSGKTFHKAVRLLRKWFGYDFDIRTLALWHKKSSSFYVDYVGEAVPEHPETGKCPWIIQPSEQWIGELRDELVKYKKKLQARSKK